MSRFLKEIASCFHERWLENYPKKIIASKSIFIFGFNDRVNPVIDFVEKLGKKVNAICVGQNQEHMSYRGIPILPVSSLSNFDFASTCGCFITYPNSLYIPQFVEQGCTCLDFTVLVYPEFFDDIAIAKKLDLINEAYQLMEDEESKRILLSLLRYRITGDITYLKKSWFPKYYHKLVKPVAGDVILDCGAACGDNVMDFTDYLMMNCRIYSFEPAQENYRKLCAEIQSRHLEEICFPINAGISSQDIILDDFCKMNRIRPTLIKADIEGFEYELLQGAEEILVKYSPKLAICVYHKYDDLWRIPLFIHRINNSYHFYLGHHHMDFKTPDHVDICETVLYCST